MPYYQWTGIHLTGKTKKGTVFAHSSQDLDALLFKRDIALLSSKTARPSLFARAPKISQKMLFFKQLATLLHAGVLLPDALIIVTEQTDNAQFQQIIFDISQQVQRGIALSAAMREYPLIFDPLMIEIVHVGQEAGRLSLSMNMLCEHLELMQEVRNRIRSASMVPAITAIFFVLIGILIFVGIIPRFETMFSSMGHELPPLTRMLINVSIFLRSWRMIVLLGFMVFCAMALRSFKRSAHGIAMIDGILLKIPFIGTVVHYQSFTTFLRSLSLLLYAGMPLAQAITHAKFAITNTVLRNHMDYLEQTVTAGSSLSEALAQHPEQLFDQELCAIVQVGQESGQLSPLLAKAATSYQERLNRSLSVCTTLIQPLLMVILGLMVTILIFAVYLPVFNLSQMTF